MKRIFSIILAIIVISTFAVNVSGAYYDEQTVFAAGVTATVNEDGSVTAGVNFMGTVDSDSTTGAVKAAAERADIVGMSVIIVYIPKGTVGISTSGVRKICNAANGKSVKLCFLISDNFEDRKIIDIKEDHGQIIAENL
jgi:hypothetical protein